MNPNVIITNFQMAQIDINYEWYLVEITKVICAHYHTM